MKSVYFLTLVTAALAVSCSSAGQQRDPKSQTQDASIREAAAKVFAQGKQVYLYDLKPNPIEDTELRTWKCSLKFIRSKDAKTALKDLKMGVSRMTGFGGVAGALPTALEISGESEGTITFDVSWTLWQSGNMVLPGVAKLNLLVPGGGDVSNAVALELALNRPEKSGGSNK